MCDFIDMLYDYQAYLTITRLLLLLVCCRPSLVVCMVLICDQAGLFFNSRPIVNVSLPERSIDFFYLYS